MWSSHKEFTICTHETKEMPDDVKTTKTQDVSFGKTFFVMSPIRERDRETVKKKNRFRKFEYPPIVALGQHQQQLQPTFAIL